jgi:hypothetical protein
MKNLQEQKKLELLSDVFSATSFGQSRASLGHFLGLTGDAPSSMTARVLIDQKFALIVASLGKLPQWRDRLVNDPYNKKFIPPQEEEVDQMDLPSVGRLVKNAAGAALEWGTSAFAKPDPWEVDLRREACLSCDQRKQAPKNLVYSVARIASGGEDDICQMCGCAIALKIMMPAEKCPLPAYEGASISRWKGEIDTNPRKVRRQKQDPT